jgi:arginyl-tRNA synthetase
MGYINKEDLNFTTKIKTDRVHLSLPDNYGGFKFKPSSQTDCDFYDYQEVNCVVEWGIWIELREWGVKNFIPTLSKVNLEFDVVRWDSEMLRDDKVGVIEISSDDDWTIEAVWDKQDLTDIGGITLIPIGVDVDFENKKIIVEF